MGSAHRSLDPRSGLVLETHDLGRHAGAMREVHATVEAPADLGIEVIGVPQGSPVVLDLRLESVVEGVLVTGTAVVELRGECVRCLVGISSKLEVDVQELFSYPGSLAAAGDDDPETSRLEGELIDLEPILRDQVVLDLPFQPVCREDCAGLCVECGADLNADPGHRHEQSVDPRWAGLRSYAAETGADDEASGTG